MVIIKKCTCENCINKRKSTQTLNPSVPGGLRRQGQCKPNAIELARIAEVQPVLADFIGKVSHNQLEVDGFKSDLLLIATICY